VDEYKNFFNLPQETGAAGRKPVFYIEYGGRCYFGFTPRLRLFYDYTVSQGIPRTHMKGRIDHIMAIFGYTDSNDGKKQNLSRKSRVSFADAVLTNNTSVMPERYLTLSEPRPTDCFNYLDQSDGMKSYNSDGMKLRGTKLYWLHNEANPGIEPGKQNVKMDSLVKPLQKGSVFHGIIRFKNLREYELGLLLWSLCLKDDSWMNLGKGKAYGYGAIKLTDCRLSFIDYQKAYGLTGCITTGMNEDLYVKKEKKELEEIIGAYKNYMRKYNGGRDLETIPMIRDFFAMRDSKKIPDAAETGYMNLEQFQNQTRTKTPLPEVQAVIAKK
jgi:CRISPR-associated protein (TIGR03986 family)